MEREGDIFPLKRAYMRTFGRSHHPPDDAQRPGSLLEEYKRIVEHPKNLSNLSKHSMRDPSSKEQ